MKRSALLLIGLALSAASSFGQRESDIRDRLAGTWKLVSTEEIMKDGTTRPFPSFGPHAKGFLMYQREGYMCADIVNPDRFKRRDPVHPTPEEKLASADGSIAYCGRYEIDVKEERLFICRKWQLIRDMWDRGRSGLTASRAAA